MSFTVSLIVAGYSYTYKDDDDDDDDDEMWGQGCGDTASYKTANPFVYSPPL